MKYLFWCDVGPQKNGKGASKRKEDKGKPRSGLDLIIEKRIHDYCEKSKLDSKLANESKFKSFSHTST